MTELQKQQSPDYTILHIQLKFKSYGDNLAKAWTGRLIIHIVDKKYIKLAINYIELILFISYANCLQKMFSWLYCQTGKWKKYFSKGYVNFSFSYFPLNYVCKFQ